MIQCAICKWVPKPSKLALRKRSSTALLGRNASKAFHAAPHLCLADSHDVGLCLARPTQDEHSCKQELAKTGSSPLQCDCWNQVCFESAAQVKCPRPDPPELVSATPVFLLVNAVLVCSRNPKLESMHALSASALRLCDSGNGTCPQVRMSKADVQGGCRNRHPHCSSCVCVCLPIESPIQSLCDPVCDLQVGP